MAAELSRHLLESGDLHLLESGAGYHLLQGSAVNIYWQNLLGNNDARDRRNYSTDIAGTIPATPDFDPTEVGALAWYDASDESTITEAGGAGTGVTTWADKSGNSEDLTVAAGGSTFANPAPTAPAYVAGQYVEFDGIADRLGADTRFGLAANPNLSVFMVIERVSEAGGGNDNRVFEIGASGAADGFLAGGITNPGWGWRYNGGNALYGSGPSDGETNLAVWTRPAGGDYEAASFREAGIELSQTSTQNPTSVPTNTTAEFRIGRGASNAGTTDLPANVRIREIIVVETSDLATIQKVEGYLNAKWKSELTTDLTSPHPFADRRPVAASTKFGTARYWRLRAVTPAEGSYYVLKTLQYWNDGVLISPNNMTSNTAPAPFVAASSTARTDEEAFEAFDGTTNQFWRPEGNNADDWISLDFGSPVTVDEIRIEGSNTFRNRVQFYVEYSGDNVNWTPSPVRLSLRDQPDAECQAYCTDVQGTDDIILGGAGEGFGPGSDDPWNLVSEDVLYANSFEADFNDGYTGSVSVDSNAAIEFVDDIKEVSGKSNPSYTNWRGRLRCFNINNFNRPWGQSGSRIELTLMGDTISRVTSSGSERTLYADIELRQTTQFRAGNDSGWILRGAVTGDQTVRITTAGGAQPVTFFDSGDFFAYRVASIEIEEDAHFFLRQHALSANQLQGIMGPDGEVASCTISFTGNDATLQMGTSDDDDPTEWANPIVVASGVTGSLLFLQGTSAAKGDDLFYAPFTIDGDLTMRLGPTGASGDVSFVGASSWGGTGTPDPNAGLISGTGRMIFERPSGTTANLNARFRLNLGCPLPTHSGGTTVLSPTTSYDARLTIEGLSTSGNWAFGTGDITLDQNAMLIVDATVDATYTLTNDMNFTGATVAEDNVPKIDVVGTELDAVHQFSGDWVIDCPAMLFQASSPSNASVLRHRITGNIEVRQTASMLLDANNRTWVDITGDFSVDGPGYTLVFKALQAGDINAWTWDFGISFPTNLDIEVQGDGGDLGGVWQDTGVTLAATNNLTVTSGMLAIANGALTINGGGFTVGPSGVIEVANRDLILNTAEVTIHGRFDDNVISGSWGSVTAEVEFNGDGGPMLVNLNGDNSARQFPGIVINTDTTFRRTTGVDRARFALREDNTPLDCRTNGSTMTIADDVEFLIINGTDFGDKGDLVITAPGTGFLSLRPPVGTYTYPSEPGVAPVGEGVQLAIDIFFDADASGGDVTVENQSQLRDVTTTNNNRSYDMTWRDVSLSGSFRRRIQNNAGSPGTGVVNHNFENTVTIAGNFELDDLANFNSTPQHQLRFTEDSITTVEGIFRPQVRPTAGYPGQNTQILMGPDAELILAGGEVDLIGTFNQGLWGFIDFDAARVPRVIWDATTLAAADYTFDGWFDEAPMRFIFRNGGANAVGVNFPEGFQAYSMEFPSFGSNGAITVNPTETALRVQHFGRLFAEAGTDVTLRIASGTPGEYDEGFELSNVAANAGLGTEAAQLNQYLCDFRNFTDVQWYAGAGGFYSWPTGVAGPVDVYPAGVVSDTWAFDFDSMGTERITIHQDIVGSNEILFWGYGNSVGTVVVPSGVTIETNRLTVEPTSSFDPPGLKIINAGEIIVYDSITLTGEAQIIDAVEARYWRVNVITGGVANTKLGTFQLRDIYDNILSPVDMTSPTSSVTFPNAVTNASNGSSESHDPFDGSDASDKNLGNGEWLSIDLGAGFEALVSRFRFFWDGTPARDYQLQWSDDGVSWNDLAFLTDANGASFVDDIDPILSPSVVSYKPRGAGALRVLDFDGKPLPNLDIIREAGSFAGDEAAYGVATTATPDPGSGGRVQVINQSATIALQFALGGDQTFGAFLTDQQAAGPLTMDFNGFDMVTQFATFDAATVIVKPVGSTLEMATFSPRQAELTAPTAQLPEVLPYTDEGLLLQNDLNAEFFLQNDNAHQGELSFAGAITLTIEQDTEIFEGTVDLTTLPGVTFTNTVGAFHVSSVNMNPASTWFVNSAMTPTASLMALSNSDASGGATGDATTSLNQGGNTNWDFGSSGGSSGQSPSGLVLGIGLRIHQRQQ